VAVVIVVVVVVVVAGIVGVLVVVVAVLPEHAWHAEQYAVCHSHLTSQVWGCEMHQASHRGGLVLVVVIIVTIEPVEHAGHLSHRPNQEHLTFQFLEFVLHQIGHPAPASIGVHIQASKTTNAL